MKDTEIQEKYGVPTRTLQDWKKKAPDNWRFKVYELLKKQDSAEINKENKCKN